MENRINKLKIGNVVISLKDDVELTVLDMFAIMHNMFRDIEELKSWDVTTGIVNGEFELLRGDEKLDWLFIDMLKTYCEAIKDFTLELDLDDKGEYIIGGRK